MDLGLELTPSVMKYYVPRYDVILLISFIIIILIFILRLYFIRKNSKNVKEKKRFIFFYTLNLILMIIMLCSIPWKLNFGNYDMTVPSKLNYTNIIIITITGVITLLVIIEMIINTRVKKKEKVS